jgi:hypothetical protein
MTLEHRIQELEILVGRQIAENAALKEENAVLKA